MARRSSLPLASTAILALLAGCSADRAPEIAGPTDAMITAAANGSGVPRDLMVAIAHLEGGLGLAAIRDVAIDETVPVAGALELRHGRYDSLARGAALMGLSELDLQIDLARGTEAGARVLDDLARDHAIARAELADWAEVVEELSGHRARSQQIAYRAAVFHLLRSGGTVRARGGEVIVLPAHDEIPLALTWAPPLLEAQGTPEYPGAIWFDTPQANKWTPGRGTPITMIAVHDTEGGWNASVATLQNDGGKSVHYIIDADGSQVGQFVAEGDTAWHAGNWFYNQHMIGIEHVGYAGLDDYQTPLYAKSADLVRAIAKRNHLGPHQDGTDLDRSVLVGHQEVPDGNAIAQGSPPCALSPGACVKSNDYGGAANHRDPGVNWEWCQYMNLIGDGASCKCNDAFDFFNCVHDLSAMVRCPAGVVELVQCPGGCVGMPNGVDDVCAADPGAASSSASAATTGSGTGSGTTGGSGVTGGSDASASSSGSAGVGGGPGAGGAGSGADDSTASCSCTTGSRPGGALPGALALAALAVSAASRRRRRGAAPASAGSTALRPLRSARARR
jgi:MYXO-CTERM domain-containing protein